MDAKTAKQLTARVRRASRLGNLAFIALKKSERSSLGQIKHYGRLLGDFMGHCYSFALAPIWKKFPSLLPTDMKGPYRPRKPSIDARTRQALREFLRQAHGAIDFSRKSIVPAQDGQPVFVEGIAEIEKAIFDIESFLKEPGHHDPKTSTSLPPRAFKKRNRSKQQKQKAP